MDTGQMMIKNKQYADEILKMISCENDVNQIIALSQLCAKLLVYNHAGIFYCYQLEKKLLGLADRYHANFSEVVRDRSFLHVFTTCMETGGHIRVVIIG
jgi:DUF1365 family protein